MRCLRTDTYTARVEHRCCLCQYPIYVGERYIYNVWVDGGDFSAQHECRFCHEYLQKHYSSEELEQMGSGIADTLIWADWREKIQEEGLME